MSEYGVVVVVADAGVEVDEEGYALVAGGIGCAGQSVGAVEVAPGAGEMAVHDSNSARQSEAGGDELEDAR